eukprot:226427-Pleurochrysis_carterae.AAC.2
MRKARTRLQLLPLPTPGSSCQHDNRYGKRETLPRARERQGALTHRVPKPPVGRSVQGQPPLALLVAGFDRALEHGRRRVASLERGTRQQRHASA